MVQRRYSKSWSGSGLFNSFTPVQLAKYAYILANKGAHKDLSLTFDSTKDLKGLRITKLITG